MLTCFKESPQISFLIDGKSYLDVPHTLTVRENTNEKITVFNFDGGLRLTHTARFYPEYGACDTVNEWENLGNEPSAIISELWDCNVRLKFPETEPKITGRAYLPSEKNAIKMYAPQGSNWTAEEFYCDVDRMSGNAYRNWLFSGSKIKYATTGGRSADSCNAPFFHIRHGKDDLGVIVAIGWTGQWNAEAERINDDVIFRSKIQDTFFRILPGEKFRTASTTALYYEGDFLDGQNAWRRFVKDVYSPVGKGEIPSLPPFCAGIWGGMSTEGVLDRINTVEKEKLPFDHYWMDAGWYGFGVEKSPDEYEGDWAQHTGNWEVNEVRHPDKLMDVVAAIEKTDKRFLLWVEPERVRSDVPLAKEHPEYLLFLDEREKNTLLDLGNEDAWQYCFNTLSDIIERLKVSVYRQDFNFRPLPYWQKYDEPERKGIKEIKYINGLYRLWDALLERFPYLLIDNCASGGRRIDIETLRRSVPLWRSDAQCPANPIPEITQSHALSHSAWMPYSGTGTGRTWFDTYCFRSAYSPALTTNFTFSEKNSFGDDPKAMAWLKEMCDEYIRVRPYLIKDVYPLTFPTASKNVWSAIQYHDSDSDSGVIQVFRRESSPYKEASFILHGVKKDKIYTFTDSCGNTTEVTGNALLTEGLSVVLTSRRSSEVIFYK